MTTLELQPGGTTHTPSTDGRIAVHGPSGPRYDEVLTPGAVDFLAALNATFAPRRVDILQARRERQQRISQAAQAGQPIPLDFLPETEAVRRDPTWQVPAPAPGLEDRRCEITGPPTRKMTVSALNSGARVWMADFEDANSPTWSNVVEGQLNLMDAIRRRIDFTTGDGKEYALAEQTATLMVRPRGWHLCEKHLTSDGHAIPAGLVDFGLFFYHNARALIDSGRGPYFYLPKMESHHEARLWNDVFTWAEQRLDIPYGTIRATCLIETVPAVFEMTEILYELRDHSAGLNAGRWDYLFSMIKNTADRPEAVLPDRADVTMTVPFMRAYTELLVRTCHARGAHAIGGMAAFVPRGSDTEASTAAVAKTGADKNREATDGFDGSWVAHPALVEVCTDAFDAVLGDRPHQLERLRDDVSVTSEQLLDTSGIGGHITVEGVRVNIRAALEYLACWLDGRGAVALAGPGGDLLMEDAATVEISRMQIWQWLRHGARTAEGMTITHDLIGRFTDEEQARLARDYPGRSDLLSDARELFEWCCLREQWPAFFTPQAYAQHLVRRVRA